MEKQKEIRPYSVLGNIWAFESNSSGLPNLQSEWPLIGPPLNSDKRGSYFKPHKFHSGLPWVMVLLRGQRIQTQGQVDMLTQSQDHLPSSTVDHTKALAPCSLKHVTVFLKTVFPRLDHITGMRTPRPGGMARRWLFIGKVDETETCRLGYPSMCVTKQGMERAMGQEHWQGYCPSHSWVEFQWSENSALVSGLPGCHKYIFAKVEEKTHFN